MSSALSFQDLEEFSKNLMKKEGVEQFDLKIEGHSGKGENYLGEVTFFTLKPKNSDKIYNLVMKTAKRLRDIRDRMPVGSAYRRELYAYCEIFPTFEKFLKEFKIRETELDYVPKIYWVCSDENRETLIMENMSMKGYKILNRMQPMEIDEASLVVEKLGKHHALSLAMKKLKPEMFNALTENLNSVWKEIFEKMNLNEFFVALSENVLSLLKRDRRYDLVEKFGNYENDIKSICEEVTPGHATVICHGDCWINNIMFKCKDNFTSSKICFLDFQLSMLDTPIKDLSYFVYTACDKKGLDNLDILLQKYYDSLAITVGLFGLKADDFFTYQELKDQWKYYGKYGLVLSLMLIKFELLEGTEAPDVGDEEFDMMKMINIEMKNQEIYNQRILDVHVHFGEKFL